MSATDTVLHFGPFKKAYLPFLAALFLLPLLVQPAFGQIHSTAEGGPWAAPSTWAGGTVPGPDDEVVITSGSTVIIESETFGDTEVAAGALTVEADGVLEGAYLVQYHVRGELINHGTIRGSDGAEYFFVVHAHSDIDSPGLLNAQLRLAGNGPRNIYIPDAPFPISIEGDIVLIGDNVAPGLAQVEGHLSLDRGATWQVIRAEGQGYFTTSFVSNDFDNSGVVTGDCALLSSEFGLFQCGSAGVHLSLRVSAEIAQGAVIVTHGGRNHPRFPSRSVIGWWTLDYESDEPAEGTFNVNFRDADIWFLTDDHDNLSLMYSPDGGVTWETPDLEFNYMMYDENALVGTIAHSGTVRPGTYVLAVEGEHPVAGQGGMITSVRGDKEIRVGAPNHFRFRYANSSDQDTGPFLISFTLPDGMPITSFQPSPAPGHSRENWTPSVWDGPANEITLVVQDMEPMEDRYIDFVVTPDDPSLCQMPGKQPHSIAAGPLGIGVGIAVATGKDYLVDLGANVLEEVIADPFSKDVRGPMRDAFDRTNQAWSTGEQPVSSLASYSAEGVLDRGWLRRGATVVGVAGNVRTVMEAVARGQRRYDERRSMGDPAPGPGPWGDYAYDYYYDTGHQYMHSMHALDPVCSWDPNDKVGPGGVGEMGHVASVGKMDFRINFENLAEATAPAYRVVIVDTLDDVFDLATLEFGETSHDGFEITRDGNVLRWEIEGIELPPNVNPPEGEGWVDFTVYAQSDLPSGTVLSNRAIITFDINDPIVTNNHVNTLDLYPPRTSLQPIPETSEQREIVLRWDADDGVDGSGVQLTSVYVSVDNGPFNLFDATSADSMVFVGQPDKQYQFYATSIDNVGNAEETPRDIISTTFRYAVSTEAIHTPLVFNLDQNHPNPFSRSTTISYTLPHPAEVTLEVFDLLGRRVARLVDTHQDAGRHETTWDGSHLASGVYVYRLTSGEHMTSRRFVIIR